MSKQTVVRLFWASVITIVAGLILALVAVWLAFASGAFVMDGPDVVGIKGNAWTLGMAVTAAIASPTRARSRSSRWRLGSSTRN